jgi:acyl transferase domain-containing protein
MSGARAIAIVGVAGRFPGASDVGALWENIAQNRSAAREVADDRWPVPVSDIVAREPGRQADHAGSSRACLLDDFILDTPGVALPPEWLPRLGRLARVTLQVGVDAWRSAKGARNPERTGVILANIALPTDGASKIAEELFLGPTDRAVDAGVPPSAIEPWDAFPSALPAGLLARALGLGGGSFTLDAACASSLYAIHLACADLEARRLDAVLCGGVSIPQSLYTQVGFTQLQALSPSGRGRRWSS